MLNLKLARIRKGMTQVELAEKIGVSKNHISRYEKDRARPSVDKLIALSDILGVSIDYLLDREK